MVYRELSSLLRAGVPLLGALDIMLQSPELSNVRVVLAATRDGIRDVAGIQGTCVAHPDLDQVREAVLAHGFRPSFLRRPTSAL